MLLKTGLVKKRQGEKIEEVLISDYEKKNSRELKNMWIIQYYTKKN